MRRVLIAALVVVLSLAAFGAGAARGARDSGARARELAARFDKDKHKVKEKYGVRVEVFLEMRGEPAQRKSPADYSGEYVSDPDGRLTLRVGADGSAEGEGYEPSTDGPRHFTLRGARVSGALLTGAKVYGDGSTERLESVFINLTTRTAPNARGTTTFGLGVVFDTPKSVDGGFDIEKLFYALKR
jgi:hypothetical protein